ncbi:PolC-type DNA polymerase III [Massilia sp. NR 4-1]|uniref:3'-5' exonuclease n=1 Tax=Massilia sp. NR 4-1 TaxID=1678028 RepID=UPI00067D573B|nr:3'-5' exonuclease [Massilia sp. NR 4-1]AKU21145.1 DNA polymerase III subunit alpha [Massilia sp. NR 4-1]
MLSQSIVMLDFETTGLSPDMGDRITEVAALRIAEGRVVERYVSLVNCNVRIPAFITSLTGITQHMVDHAPAVAEVMPRLLDFIGTDPLSAHNASFDEKFLRAESARLGLAPGHAATVCSLKLARRVLPQLGSYKLGLLSESLGIRFSGQAHRAEADAEVAAEVLLHIGRHIAREYGIAAVDTALLLAVNKLAAAKVPAFLRKQQGA